MEGVGGMWEGGRGEGEREGEEGGEGAERKGWEREEEEGKEERRRVIVIEHFQWY